MGNLKDGLKGLIPGERIKEGKEIPRSYYANTIGAHQDILGVISPVTCEEIQALMAAAAAYSWHLYPISTGKNWGYGSRLPPTPGNIIVDLSSMKHISDYDAELGIVTVEPGVTQGDLYNFLQENGDLHMVPATGAGPNASILGNALERGYGLTPETDHFEAIHDLKVVLPNGRLMSTGFDNFDAYQLKGVFKNPPGMSVSGLFTQSSLGIVTSMTIRLACRSKHSGIFTCKFSAEDLTDAVNFVRMIRQEYQGIVGGVNLMCPERMTAISSGVERDWTILGGLYGSKAVTDGAGKEIKRLARKYGCRQFIFLNGARVRAVKGVYKGLESLGIMQKFRLFVGQALSIHELLNGRPSQLALPLPYSSIQKQVDIQNDDLDPALDGCGLLWFAPLMPLKSESVKSFVMETQKICARYQIPSMITLTAITSLCIDATIPILFDPKDERQAKNARKAHTDLMKMAMSQGLLPYRFSSTDMKRFYDEYQNSSLISFASDIKKAIDPANVVSPGRYHYHQEGPTEEEMAETRLVG